MKTSRTFLKGNFFSKLAVIYFSVKCAMNEFFMRSNGLKLTLEKSTN